MKFFIDTADIDAIREIAKSGLVDGVTTNPSLVAKTGRSFLDLIKEICDVVDGPVSAEVAATDYETMVAEGRKLAKIADNVVVKLPLTPDGLKACRTFTDEGIQTNVTLCFSVGQAILAAKAGATLCMTVLSGELNGVTAKTTPNGTRSVNAIRCDCPGAPAMGTTSPLRRRASSADKRSVCRHLEISPLASDRR